MTRYTKLALVLLPVLAVALVAAGEAEDVAPGAVTGGMMDAPGDILFTLDVQTPCDDDQLLGVEYVSPYYYITGGGGTSGMKDNTLYVVDKNGTLIDSFLQGTVSSWGWRDLAYDGTYLYASDSINVDYFDLNGVLQGSFAGPINPNRALAYDPATGNFWTASFSSDIYEFNDTDGVVNQFTNPGLAIYGMAWDDVSDDGPWLWIFSQDTNNPITQFDPVNGITTGVSYDASVTGIAGGLCIVKEDVTPDPDGKEVLVAAFVGLSQDEPDSLIGVELLTCDGCWIEDVCYADQDPNPDNECEICDVATSETEWTANEGATCDDELWCTVDDACTDAGVCEGTERDCDDGEFCTGEETCNEDTDECVSAGDPCNEDEVCNEDTDQCDPLGDDDDDDDDDDDTEDDDDDHRHSGASEVRCR